MQSPGDNDMGKSREQRTREARAAKAEAARLAAEAEAARLASEGTSPEVLETSPAPESFTQSGTSTGPQSHTQSGTSIGTEGFTQSGTSTTEAGTSTGSEESTQYGTSAGSDTPQLEPVPPQRIIAPPPPPPGGGRVLSSLIASSPPDAGLTPPSSLVAPTGVVPPPPPPPPSPTLSPSAPLAAAPGVVTPSAPSQYAPSHTQQDSQPETVPDRPIRQRIIGAPQPGTSAQPPAQGAPPPRMIGLPNPDGTAVPPGSPVQAADLQAPQTQVPAPPQPIPVNREPRPEQGMTLDGKVCRHEYVRIYQRKLKGLDRRLVATRAFLPVGFKMGDFTYLSAGSFCFCSKCRKRLFPKRTEAEKQQARVERKQLKEMGGIDLMAVGKPRDKSEFDDELEDELDFLEDSDDESIFGKRTISETSEASDESDENLDDDKLKLDIHVDELEVESVDVEDIKAEGVKLTPEDDFDEACSLDVEEES